MILTEASQWLEVPEGALLRAKVTLGFPLHRTATGFEVEKDEIEIWLGRQLYAMHEAAGS